MLRIRDLSVTALGSKPLVDKVSLDIAQGEVLALVGESGSGKTLTALSIMGLLPSGLRQSGEITFEEVAGGTWNVAKKDEPSSRATRHASPLKRGKDIGMIFQEPMTSLNPLHTIGKQIGEAVRVWQRSLSAKAVQEKVIELLGKVRLSHFANRLDAYPYQLSGGERQRVMIAMAIANNPALLIADEPTTALDVTIQAQILTLLKELQKDMKMSMLMITHDLGIVRRVADRVAIMTQGQIVETGKTADIFAAPKHDYTRHLLASEKLGQPNPSPTKGKAAMECRNLSVAFAVGGGLFTWKKKTREVVSDVALFVPQGGTLGVVGESGSGKTSLALALLRLTPSRGNILLEGSRIDALTGAALRAKRSDMQIVFQDPFSSLNPRMTIGHIVREGLDVHAPKMSATEKEAEVAAILKEVGLPPEATHRYPHEFSGGQRQRISIARALILKPRVMVLDEPTSSLDMSVQTQILELLKRLQAKHGLSYIFISHDLRTVRAISHSIVVLKDGRVVEEGTAAEIFAKPKEEYTRALLKAALV